MTEITGTLDGGAVLRVGSISNIMLNACRVSAATDPDHRSVIRDGVLEKCKHDGCFIHGASIESVKISDLRGAGRLGTFLRGCVFSNVVVKGNVSGVNFQRDVSESPSVNLSYSADAMRRYLSIDVALDISGAEFQDLVVFQGIPPDRIRRDKDKQFYLPRDRCKDVVASSSTLLVVAKMASGESDGAVFAFGAKTERDRRRIEECKDLQRRGLLL